MANRINAARVAIGDTGDEQRLIKTLPRKGVRFVGAVREGSIGAEVRSLEAPSSVSEKPSIAVLPFLNLSGDADTDYFVDGIVEDIITALSRNRGCFVIARNSTFTYKGGLIDVKQVSRDLGVRYVLEGSIRVSGDRMRVTGQLIEGSSGRHLWADKFDCTSGDPFELQDRLVERVVGAIAPQLEKAEMDRARRELTSNPAAYDLYLRGLRKLEPLVPGRQCEGIGVLLRGHTKKIPSLLRPMGWPPLVTSLQRRTAGSRTLTARKSRVSRNALWNWGATMQWPCVGQDMFAPSFSKKWNVHSC